ncbi:hypothetical protein ACFWPQ_22430 [Streptomyces sp. NPDC058464]|uniref:hypothetical protein n=1 Tax=Streptomyces sp. NPDC058464 TaxID=3346511 RepID=UPI00365F904B
MLSGTTRLRPGMGEWPPITAAQATLLALMILTINLGTLLTWGRTTEQSPGAVADRIYT